VIRRDDRLEDLHRIPRGNLARDAIPDYLHSAISLEAVNHGSPFGMLVRDAGTKFRE
jgi:hypothetical protein